MRIHIYPENDTIGHDLDTDNCPCGPELQHQDHGPAGDSWLIIHHSLDGREKSQTT